MRIGGRGMKRSRRKRKSSGFQTLLHRFLIVATLVIMGAYIIPFSTGVLDESDGTVVSSLDQEITVRVLNGCGIGGMALRGSRYLRRMGFDVVEMENALDEKGSPRFDYEETEIWALTENREAAKIVKEALGFGRVVYAPDSTQQLHVSVTLGADCAAALPTDRTDLSGE